MRLNALHEAEAPNPRKKKPLTEIEIALKREETARKRRNLTEKKLEDEKVSVCISLGLLYRSLTREIPGRDNQSPSQEAVPCAWQTECARDGRGQTCTWRQRPGRRRGRRHRGHPSPRADNVSMGVASATSSESGRGGRRLGSAYREDLGDLIFDPGSGAASDRRSWGQRNASR